MQMPKSYDQFDFLGLEIVFKNTTNIYNRVTIVTY